MSKKNQTHLEEQAKTTRRRPTIGFFNIYIGPEWATWPWHGAMDAARKYDLNLITCIGKPIRWPENFEEQANIIYALAKDGRLDGLILWKAGLTMFLTEPEIEALCNRYNIPIVTIEGAVNERPCVTYSNYQGMRSTVDHLIEVHGYRRIGFMGLHPHHLGFGERHRAYVDAMAAHGLPVEPQLDQAWLPADVAADEKRTEQAISNWLQQATALGVEAIVGVTDVTAYQLMRLLQAQGFHVPDDVAVVGFDGFTESRFSTPPLTTVKPSWFDLGYSAVEMLVQRLDGKPAPEQLIVPHLLSVRQSCGCMDSSVVAAAGEALKTMGKSQPAEAVFDLQSITAEMVRVAQAGEVKEIHQKLERLVASCQTEITGENAKSFLRQLDDILRQSIQAGGDVSFWQDAFSIFRQSILSWLENQNMSPVAIQRFETLCQQVRVLIGKSAERDEASQRLQSEQRAAQIRVIEQSLITTLDVTKLMDVLANSLPSLGISGCYLSLYEDPIQYHYPDNAPGWSRLILAYNQAGRIVLDPDGQRFPSVQMIPDEFWEQDRPLCFVAEPFYFREEGIGFALFETNSRDGGIFETLRADISIALHGAQLVQRVQERSAELTRQQYILDAFMDNIPDSIYFKDAQSCFTRANRALAIRIGVKDPSELIGKSDFDFYPLEQAEVKYQQEQELIKTGQPILGLEEPDGIDHWAMTTKMPLRDEKGAVIGTFGISSDITELVKAKQAAEAAVKEADKALALAEIEKEKAKAAKNEAEKAHHEVEVANRSLAAQMWQTTGQALLNEKMRGEQDIPTLANNIIQQLSKYLGVDNGAIYILEDKILRLAGTYAYRKKSLVQQYQVGEGRVGQAVIEKEIILKEFPDDYIALSLRQGKVLPKYSLVAPVVYNQEVSGVVALESMTEFTPAQMGFLENAIESVAIAFMTAQARARVNELFSQTRQQAQELQSQEEELRATNEELEVQTESLRASETRLKSNQSALEAANVDLEEKSQILQEKQAALDRQNKSLRDAQQELERKAEELTATNKYKSEFLANMSHELRTPLNSLLILSRMLANNEGGNLTPDQTESAQIIHSSGADLLELINEILDLSKVEAGHMNFNFAPMPFENLAHSMRSQFEHMVEQKKLKFEVSLAAGLPERIMTDQQRVEQVIKNLLSNAFKFTEKGAVQLIIEPDGEMIAIRVRDTGIGMTPEQQQRVFEAFQQADGSTSRKYGGTGLGLTISREMTAKLGGRIGLESKPGKGSEFTLYLPLYRPETESIPAAAPASITATPAEARPAPDAKKLSAVPVTISKPAPPVPDDDRDKIQKGDKVLLVIEDDEKFAKILFDYAHKKDFKCVLAYDGESGLKLATVHPPDAILLDLKLPGVNGWYVLDTLKGDASLRHIPVHILSATEQTMDAYQRGALGFLSKPISQDQLDDVFATIGDFLSRDIKSLLIVEDDSGLRYSVGQLLGGSDVKISEAASGDAALALLHKAHFDCMILDLTLPDMTGFELLNKIDQDKSISKCPVIVYTGKALTEEENTELLKYASSVIIKGVKSPERLLDETALFLHRVVADMPAEKQDTIHRLHDRDAAFSGKHVLVVDDNMRNAFALSRLLSDRNLQVSIARSGAKALEMLETVSDIDLVLMDIMMPGMDGYETMQRVRAQPKFKNLPMLALTAKAMKGDLEKCIAAGANDYLSKPVDADRLFSMLRVWLYR